MLTAFTSHKHYPLILAPPVSFVMPDFCACVWGGACVLCMSAARRVEITRAKPVYVDRWPEARKNQPDSYWSRNPGWEEQRFRTELVRPDNKLIPMKSKQNKI